jgi:hypothetical protein
MNPNPPLAGALLDPTDPPLRTDVLAATRHAEGMPTFLQTNASRVVHGPDGHDNPREFDDGYATARMAGNRSNKRFTRQRSKAIKKGIVVLSNARLLGHHCRWLLNLHGSGLIERLA